MKREFPKVIFIPAHIQTSDIVRKASECFEVKISDILSKDRKRSITDARHAVITLFSHKGMSNIEIADFFDLGPTISRGVRYATRDKYETDPFFASRFNMVVAMLKGESLSLDIEEAKKLATQYTLHERESEMPVKLTDAAEFFLAGYNYALKQLKLV